MSLKIQLLHPPGIYHARNLSSLTPSLPLGLAYVAAALEKAGFPVGVIDAIGEAPTRVERDGEFRRVGLGTSEILGRIAPGTRVIGISLMFSFLWPSTRELIRAIRAARPDVLLVGGGEHFTGLAEYSMSEAPLDFIVMGEGEETIVELMDALAAGRTDFEEIPGLACSSPSMWTQRWLPRDPIDVADEIEHYVRAYGAMNFPFQDLTAIIRKDWIVTFCQELIRRRLNVVWQFPSGTRCEAIDDEVAPLLRDSGGRHLAFAPESGSERTRNLIKKKMTTPALLASVRASVRAGLNVTAFFVLGFPHDTREDIRGTVRLARRLAVEGIDDINMSFFFPIPNTELYHDLVKKGRVQLTDGFFMAPITSVALTLRAEDNYCEALTARQLTALKYWVFLNFYVTSFLARPSRLLRLLTCLVTTREDSKLEAFAQEMKRRLKISLAQAFGRRYSSNP